ncbi:MAG: hypothetical protein HYY18_03730 [Planctomycetes bacterium]|nr:hypothetical protein [Planctomycetota bacterium]
MRVENDEMYGDWAHWLQAPCPGCTAPLRAHHLHEFAGLVCAGCRRNPVLHFAGVAATDSHPGALTDLLLADGFLSEVAADVARETKADAPLPAYVEFLLGLRYIKPEALEAFVRKHAPASWIDGISMTYDPVMAAPAAAQPPADGDRVNLEDCRIDAELLKRVPRTVARVYRCVPVWADTTVIAVAVDDADKVRREDLEGLLRCEVRLVICPKAQITAALAKHYGSSGWQDALW